MSAPTWLVWQMAGKVCDVPRGIADAATWHLAARGERPTAVLLNPAHEAAIGATVTVDERPMTVHYRLYVAAQAVYVGVGPVD